MSRPMGRIRGLLFALAVLAAAGVAHGATLVWDAAPGNVTGYRAYYGTEPGKYPNVVDVGRSTSRLQTTCPTSKRASLNTLRSPPTTIAVRAVSQAPLPGRHPTKRRPGRRRVPACGDRNTCADAWPPARGRPSQSVQGELISVCPSLRERGKRLNSTPCPSGSMYVIHYWQALQKKHQLYTL